MSDQPTTQPPPVAKPDEQLPPPPATLGREPKHRRPQATATPLYDPQDLLGLDPDSMDPDMHYRIIRDDAGRAAQARLKGYQPVSRSEDGVRLIIDTADGAAEDLIRIGDGVLYACPKEVYQQRRQQIQNLTDARLSVEEAQFRKKARKSGVEVVTGKDIIRED